MMPRAALALLAALCLFRASLQQTAQPKPRKNLSKRVCLRGLRVDRKCYLPMTDEKSFHRAADDCILHGGVLGSAENDEENQALYHYARRKLGENRNIWIGVTDIASEGTWVDVTGKLVNYTNWEMGSTLQPDGGTKENCVALSWLANGQWLDQPCRSLHRYLCQFNIP